VAGSFQLPRSVSTGPCWVHQRLQMVPDTRTFFSIDSGGGKGSSVTQSLKDKRIFPLIHVLKLNSPPCVVAIGRILWRDFFFRTFFQRQIDGPGDGLFPFSLL